MGLAAALVTISSLTMITDLTVERNRGAGMGAFDLANLGGYGIGILLGTVFSTIFASNLGNTFLVVAGIFGVATVFIFLALREPPHGVHQRKSLREMYNSLTGDVAAIFPVWFSLTIIVGLYFFLPRLAKNASADLSNSAGLLTLGLVVLGAGSVLFGRLSDKIGRTRTILMGVVGETGFLLVFPDLFQKLIVIPKGQAWTVSLNQVGPIGIIGGVLFFMGSALIPSILAYVGDKAAHEFRGSAMGLYSLMLSAGIATGNVIAGVADQLGSETGGPQAGVQAVFYSGVVIFAGLSLTTGLLLRRVNRLPAPAADLDKNQNKPI
jgi:MFS family permease